ncbi:MAG: hypothetical protein V7L00_24600 [Nostoc sp.]|uniref:hypothetical protein n=1 Tax=Nostoc sp. TaxID=1180 RepID=UPI002FFCC1B2
MSILAKTQFVLADLFATELIDLPAALTNPTEFVLARIWFYVLCHSQEPAVLKHKTLTAL